jgi:hypothetical protein
MPDHERAQISLISLSSLDRSTARICVSRRVREGLSQAASADALAFRTTKSIQNTFMFTRRDLALRQR